MSETPDQQVKLMGLPTHFYRFKTKVPIYLFIFDYYLFFVKLTAPSIPK